jgi:hypothetical protein
VSAPGRRVLSGVFCPRSVTLWPGQRWSIAFSNGPPKTKMTRTSAAPQHDDLPLGDCASRTDTGGHPDAGRCRQPVDVMTFAISDNNTCAQKTDSGYDALDNAAGVGAGDGVDG